MKTTNRRGFTLIELLVVIAIIAGPDRPALAGRAGGPGRPPAARSAPTISSKLGLRCTTTLRLATISPSEWPGASTARPPRRPSRAGPAGVPAQALMLSQLEQTAVYNSCNFAFNPNSTSSTCNSTAVNTILQAFPLSVRSTVRDRPGQ